MHLELLRNDEGYLDALRARRIPAPTTAGDFGRRFDTERIDGLQEVFNEMRLMIWRQQPDDFFREAVLDADGTMVQTTGQCKEGVDINSKSQWGYHPLMLSLANTGEPLCVVNRSGSCSSHEQAAADVDKAIEMVRLPEGRYRKCPMLTGVCDNLRSIRECHGLEGEPVPIERRRKPTAAKIANRGFLRVSGG